MWFHVYFIIKIYLERIGYYPIREINVRYIDVGSADVEY